MTTIIFAAGPATRWAGARFVKWGGVRDVANPPEHKQMISIGDEPNLFRTIRILKEVGETHITVFASPGIAAEIPQDVTHSVVVFDDWGLHSLLDRFVQGELAYRNSSRTRFIHGDVVFSRETLANILDESESSIRFVGRFGPNKITGKAAPELFGLSVAREMYPALLEACRTLPVTPAKLWNLREAMTTPGYPPPDFEINDWTDDIDSAEEYVEFYPILCNHALAEDEVHRGHG